MDLKLVDKDFKRVAINKFQGLKENMDIKKEQMSNLQRNIKPTRELNENLRRVQYLCEMLSNEIKINVKNVEENLSELEDQSIEKLRNLRNIPIHQ